MKGGIIYYDVCIFLYNNILTKYNIKGVIFVYVE